MNGPISDFEIDIFKKDISVSEKFIEWFNNLYLIYSINTQIAKRIDSPVYNFSEKTIKELDEIFMSKLMKYNGITVS